ncbi:ER membrane protein complex subunit 6-like isoform X2 [Olea europaea var. sylvestris]|uniref:ER membrane protein complex subunit 6-like isoform X2 n=1 Tax=Olea europaea var. sylvestris TaxID=158386 RepID=UPI000C1D7EC3|nr:ER membrane protein complex subunit 6-like isoform X2 [Olea europaea var. sylvestris]
MAGRDESSVSRKQSSDGADEISTFNVKYAKQRENYILQPHMSIIGGVIAGLLGFTGLRGFIFYFLVMAITSVGIAAKAGFYVRPYFDSWNQILLDGFLGGLLSFVLFWTYSYFYIYIFYDYQQSFLYSIFFWVL